MQPEYNDLLVFEEDSLPSDFRDPHLDFDSDRYDVSRDLMDMDSPQERQPMRVEILPTNKLRSFRMLNPNDLSLQYSQICQLLSKCKMLEKAIYDKSTEPLFQFSIGFDFRDDHYDNSLQKVNLESFLMTQRRQKQQKLIQNSFPKQREDVRMEMRDDLYEESVWEMNESRVVEEDKATTDSLLKEYVESGSRGVKTEDKLLFVQLRNVVEELSQLITQHHRAREDNDHYCKICGMEFDSGRQLGGHMSRKHPGKSHQYSDKKEMRKTKMIERERRKYFKIRVPSK